MRKSKQKVVTKRDLAVAITKNLDLGTEQSTKIVSLFFDTIIQGLKEDSEVKISRFGNFKIKGKKERIGRNPKTREDAIIPARKIISFSLSKFMRDKLNCKN